MKDRTARVRVSNVMHPHQLVDLRAYLKAFCESGSLTSHSVQLIILKRLSRQESVILASDSVKSFAIHHSLWFQSPPGKHFI